MENPFKTVYLSIRQVLSTNNWTLVFLGMILIILTLLIAIPVISIPGNSVLFQLSIWEFKDYIVIIPLSFLVALMITMQIYSFRLKKSNKLKETGKGLLSSYSGIVAGVFGTASCSSCVAAIFGFLGIGGVFFLIKYQWYVVFLSITLVILSLYLTSLNIQSNCKEC